MAASRDRSQMSRFSLMQSAFCFSNVDPIFVGRKRVDAMSDLKNNPKVNASICINAGYQLFGNYFALYS